MPPPRFSNEGIAQGGEEIYPSRLRAHLEKEHTGQIVIIGLESGDHGIGHASLAASKRAPTKHLGAALYGIRVGFPFAESIGL